MALEPLRKALAASNPHPGGRIDKWRPACMACLGTGYRHLPGERPLRCRECKGKGKFPPRIAEKRLKKHRGLPAAVRDRKGNLKKARKPGLEYHHPTHPFGGVARKGLKKRLPKENPLAFTRKKDGGFVVRCPRCPARWRSQGLGSCDSCGTKAVHVATDDSGEKICLACLTRHGDGVSHFQVCERNPHPGGKLAKRRTTCPDCGGEGCDPSGRRACPTCAGLGRIGAPKAAALVRSGYPDKTGRALAKGHPRARSGGAVGGPPLRYRVLLATAKRWIPHPGAGLQPVFELAASASTLVEARRYAEEQGRRYEIRDRRGKFIESDVEPRPRGRREP